MNELAKHFIGKKQAITPSPILNRISQSDIALLTKEDLEALLYSRGSELVHKVANGIAKKEQEAERERKILHSKLKPYLESRKKIEDTINETVARIRKLPPEDVSSEGIKEAKTLYSLLGEIEKNDHEIQDLGMNVSYSYRQNDLILTSTPMSLQFLDKIRSNLIFREPKQKEE